jgi:RHS repeat-associated protein
MTRGSPAVGPVTVSYGYDGQNIRVSHTLNGVTTTQLWDRQAGLPELVQDGATQFVQGPAGVAEEDDGSSATYPIHDGIGSTSAVADQSGAVVGTQEYDAWGNPRTQSGSTSASGWAGEVRDSDTGLTYLRARDYAPGSGRFTTRDTMQPNLAGTQGYNPYAYAANDPVTYVDPSGHLAETFPPMSAPVDDLVEVVEVIKGETIRTSNAIEISLFEHAEGVSHGIEATGLGEAELTILWGQSGSILSWSLVLIATLAGLAVPLAGIAAETAFMFAVVALLFFLLAVLVTLMTRTLQCLGFGLGSCAPQSVSVTASLTQVFGEGKQVIDMAVRGIRRDKKPQECEFKGVVPAPSELYLHKTWEKHHLSCLQGAEEQEGRMAVSLATPRRASGISSSWLQQRPRLSRGNYQEVSVARTLTLVKRSVGNIQKASAARQPTVSGSSSGTPEPDRSLMRIRYRAKRGARRASELDGYQRSDPHPVLPGFGSDRAHLRSKLGSYPSSWARSGCAPKSSREAPYS